MKTSYLLMPGSRDEKEGTINLGHYVFEDKNEKKHLISFLSDVLKDYPPLIGVGLKDDDISFAVDLAFAGDDYTDGPVWSKSISDIVDEITNYGNIGIAKKVSASFIKYAAILDEWVEEEEEMINSRKQGV